MPGILVTGGTSPIGKSIVRVFLDDSWTVYLHYNSSEKTAKSFAENKNDVNLFQANLSSLEDCNKLANKIKSKNDLHVLVNNAAVFNQVEDTVQASDWNLPMDVNARAPWILTTKLSDQLSSNDGSVINITDAATIRPYSDYIPYFASKGALETLTKGLARAMSPGVRVNGVAPGPIDFPDSYSESKRNNVISKTLLERHGNYEEVASAVYYLAVEATYTTGNILDVDGGRHLN